MQKIRKFLRAVSEKNSGKRDNQETDKQTESISQDLHSMIPQRASGLELIPYTRLDSRKDISWLGQLCIQSLNLISWPF